MLPLGLRSIRYDAAPELLLQLRLTEVFDAAAAVRLIGADGLTVTLVDVAERLDRESVAVRVWVPAVWNVTVKACEPLSDAANV